MLPEGYEKTDYPSVPYRGIFINDEEELERWAKLHMGEETIGVHTYRKNIRIDSPSEGKLHLAGDACEFL